MIAIFAHPPPAPKRMRMRMRRRRRGKKHLSRSPTILASSVPPGWLSSGRLINRCSRPKQRRPRIVRPRERQDSRADISKISFRRSVGPRTSAGAAGSRRTFLLLLLLLLLLQLLLRLLSISRLFSANFKRLRDQIHGRAAIWGGKLCTTGWRT